MLRALGIGSSLATVLWLAVIRVAIWDTYYRSSQPFGQVIALAMIVIYLGVAGVMLLGIKSILKKSIALLTVLLIATMAWTFLDVGLSWPSILLWALQTCTLVMVVALYRRPSVKQGPSVLDMPIFG
ncbi:MAG: hypothetical protein HYU02_07920 [Thaumarchaeota archaeon]|nr:hypothetical protein [Nitrososphaerota archaeon]